MGFFSNLLAKRTKPAKTAASKEDSKKTSYRGVVVHIDDSSCCQAAHTIAGKRFLSESAPMLPLADCDADDCRCTYRRFDDRRADIRRAGDVAFDVVGEYWRDDKRGSDSSGRRNKDKF